MTVCIMQAVITYQFKNPKMHHAEVYIYIERENGLEF